MAFFDIFIPWKKKYNDFVTNHYDDVLAYINNSYEVYNDMRQDHKTLFNEYQQQYEIEIKYLVDDNSLETLSDDTKKYILKNKEHVLLLSKTFKIYATKKERVILLSKRFSVNNIFNKAAFKFVKKNNIEEMTEEDYDTILDNYEYMVKKMTYVQNIKKKKQQELRDRLQKRIKERKEKLIEEKERIIAERIRKEKEEKKRIEQQKKQEELEKEYQKYEDHLDLYPFTFEKTVKLENKLVAFKLYDKFKDNDIFNRVVLSLFPEKDSSNIILKSKDIKLLNKNREDFDVEVEFFQKKLDDIDLKIFYLPFIKSKGLNDNHGAIMYCLYNMNAFEAFVNEHAYGWDVSFHRWNLNQSFADHYVDKLNIDDKVFKTRMFVDTIFKEVYNRTVLTFPHIIYYDMSGNGNDLLRKRVKAAECIKEGSANTPRTGLQDVHDLACSLSNYYSKDEAIFVFGNSDLDKSSLINHNNFYYLVRKLKQKKYDSIVDLDDNTEQLKCVIVLEVVSSVENFRKTSKIISRKCPGAGIIYISIYGELTDNQIKRKYGNTAS